MLQHLKNIILEQTKKKERKKREAHFSFSAPSHPEGGHVQVASQKESGTELDISLLFLKKNWMNPLIRTYKLFDRTERFALSTGVQP